MPRSIEFGDHELVLRFTGLLAFETLTATFRIPYDAIRSVTTEPFQAPFGTLRIFGTSIPFTDIREGRFIHGSEWYFLSFEHRDKTVTLELANFHHGAHPDPYRFVVIGSDDPAGLQAAIEAARLRAKSPSSA
ncbi:MAG: hypothetical protein L3K03_03695 [Thermoplasmata archaeon]|nr:hypothetical protein [Thermoplasmata archaeon]